MSRKLGFVWLTSSSSSVLGWEQDTSVEADCSRTFITVVFWGGSRTPPLKLIVAELSLLGTIEIPGEIKLNAPESSDSLRSRKERKPLYCNVKLSSIGQPDRILGKDSSENIQWLIDKFCSDVQETVHLGIILTSFESKVSCFRDGLLKKKSGKCNKYLKAQKASPRCGALQT
ncbi:hypothetical protein F2Q69_00036468 [Brassica cretica]|uniref:Uncharacterized protein n=1 Tax=Brassica cretica TaxID=69181 RepID=A0A8S9SDP1_BRACR|nr:hypothetical protein F2Q69_00036468 [Brassica cretica]